MLKQFLQNRITSVCLFSIAMAVSVVYFDLFLSFDFISFGSKEKEKTEWVEQDFKSSKLYDNSCQDLFYSLSANVSHCQTYSFSQDQIHNHSNQIRILLKQTNQTSWAFSPFKDFSTSHFFPENSDLDHLS